MAQTQELPQGCWYMPEFHFQVKNPFPRSALFPKIPLTQEGIDFTGIALTPQFRVRNLPIVGYGAANRRATDAKEQLVIACGQLHIH
jgi:hypothetical protein